MKVLMFGWEFPPFSSGGLGTACFGITKGMSQKNIDVTFVVPKAGKYDSKHVKVISPNSKYRIKTVEVDSPLMPYMTTGEYSSMIIHGGSTKNAESIYGSDLFKEVYRYSQIAGLIALNEEHDIIHCHDWMTYKAGINAKKMSNKPLVLHIHATEFDRSGGLGQNQIVYDIEKEGFLAADKIIAVSNFTKNKLVDNYGIDPDKIEVVHNAVEFNDNVFPENKLLADCHRKIVLFLGRITMQKGPDYFLHAAKRVLDHDPNVTFVMAGSGDMEQQIIEQAAELGIADNFLFAGFLSGADIDRAYQMASLYVMPSVSEPFGITPLEAMRNNTPVIISKQSGVSEVISHCLKVDFWDIDEMSNMILSTLKYDELHQSLTENAKTEVSKFCWSEPAQKCIDVYNKLGVY